MPTQDLEEADFSRSFVSHAGIVTGVAGNSVLQAEQVSESTGYPVDGARIGPERQGTTSAQLAVGFFLFVAIQAIGTAIHTATFVCLIIWALGGPKKAIQALTLSWFLTFLSPAIVTATAAEDVLRWLVLLAAGTGVFVRLMLRREGAPTVVLAILTFSTMATGISMLSSHHIDVSLFKIGTFAFGSCTILTAFHHTRADVDYWHRWFRGIFVAVLAISIPLAAIPQGYLRNGTGFQGILNHPQAFAVFLAPLTGWLGTKVVLREHKGSDVLLLGVALTSLFLTRGRTGVVAIGLAALMTAIFALMRRPRWRRQMAAAVLRPRRMLVLCCALVGVIVGSGQLYDSARTFALKGRVNAKIGESFDLSRGFLIERSWQNFEEHPITGIGFGMPSDPSRFEIRRDPFLGLPVGASVEKGILPVAVLEELGVLGGVTTLILFIALLRLPAAALTPSALVLALTAITVNFGESIFFSMGGMGLYTWLLIGYARTSR